MEPPKQAELVATMKHGLATMETLKMLQEEAELIASPRGAKKRLGERECGRWRDIGRGEGGGREEESSLVPSPDFPFQPIFPEWKSEWKIVTGYKARRKEGECECGEDFGSAKL